ncbi:tRNA (adenosine(37)-N6)-dimethylallyltransferase MiaA [Candidatus Microgenomates bacterium]|nr:tRNA (adenosine(37)-N6)-dimethylallyltransferase MiaA [Candidatus Microgenomates bacterium]
MTKENKKPKIIVICGPTGSGKTALAVFLCQKFGGEIISADSRQVYRGMDIGTGKEVENERGGRSSAEGGGATSAGATISGIPIHLVDIVDPDERFTVADFKILAEEKIAEIVSRGKVPFLVGGTGLYLDALTENFSFPQISNSKFLISKQIQSPNAKNPKLYAKRSMLNASVEMLLRLDPKAQYEIDLKNPRRVARALEVCLATGRPFTEQKTKGKRKYEALKLAPKVETIPSTSAGRHELSLREKIDQRVDQMITDGLEAEAQSLAEKYGWDAEAMTGIGYREWASFLGNPKPQILNAKEIQNPKLEIQKIAEQIKINSRRYAKRQMTWFKRDKEIHWVKNKKEAEYFTRNFLLQ